MPVPMATASMSHEYVVFHGDQVKLRYAIILGVGRGAAVHIYDQSDTPPRPHIIDQSIRHRAVLDSISVGAAA